MGIVATLLPHAGRAQRLRLALRDRHTMLECDTWPMLLKSCEEQAVQLVVVDLYADGPANFEAVRYLKNRFPTLTLVAYIAFAPGRVRDVFDVGRSGLDGMVLADQEDSPRALAGLIDQAEARSVSGVLRRSIGELPPTVRDAIMLSVTRAHERLTPARLAEIIGISRRSLATHLAAAGYPPPHQVLTWGRLIVAAHLLEDARRKGDAVAVALDFPSGSAFRNSCQRYLHGTPGEIRRRGGAGYVIRSLLRQVRGSESGRAGRNGARRRSPQPAV